MKAKFVQVLLAMLCGIGLFMATTSANAGCWVTRGYWSYGYWHPGHRVCNGYYHRGYYHRGGYYHRCYWHRGYRICR